MVMSQNYNTLHHFTVELAIRGINESSDPSAQQDFDFELSMRPHIIQKTVIWDRAEHQVTIRLVTEGIDPQTTSKEMAEELFEVASALLNEIEGLHVVVLNVEENRS